MFRYLAGLALFHSLTALALSGNVAQTIEWETQSNGTGVRSSAPIAIRHFEIPLSLVDTRISASLEPETRAALIFERDGIQYLRWIINPEDTYYVEELRTYLKELGLDAETYLRFTGYLTASRSVIIEDPLTGAEFSAKVGTNRTGGNWQNKPWTAQKAVQSALTQRDIEELQKRVQFKRTRLMEEPASFGIHGIDHGFTVRSLRVFHENPDKYYLTLLSAVHEKLGRDLAKRNGSDDPAAFWLIHADRVVPDSDAEVIAFTGRVPQEGHGQNHLMELDKNFRPTGWVARRDYADWNLLKGFHENLLRKGTLYAWPKDHVVKAMRIIAGPAYGNRFPEWLDYRYPFWTPRWLRSSVNDPRAKEMPEVYQHWLDEYYAAFRQRFTQITGIPMADFGGSIKYDKNAGVGYFPGRGSEGWNEYLRLALCYQGFPFDATGRPCPETLTKRIESYLAPTCKNAYHDQLK